MPKFAVLLRQDDEGCGHTIGCGIQIMHLQATSSREALVEVKKILQGTPDDDYECGFAASWLNPKNDFQLKSAVLVQIEEELPLGEWRNELRGILREREMVQDATKERAEYERLKKKFG